MDRQRQGVDRLHIPAHFWLVFALVALLGLTLGLNPRPALAHGDATLVVNPAVTAPGGVIEVTAAPGGLPVEASEEFTLTLEGINGQTPLGTVTVGTMRFSARSSRCRRRRRRAATKWSRPAAKGSGSQPN